MQFKNWEKILSKMFESFAFVLLFYLFLLEGQRIAFNPLCHLSGVKDGGGSVVA